MAAQAGKDMLLKIGDGADPLIEAPQIGDQLSQHGPLQEARRQRRQLPRPDLELLRRRPARVPGVP